MVESGQPAIWTSSQLAYPLDRRLCPTWSHLPRLECSFQRLHRRLAILILSLRLIIVDANSRYHLLGLLLCLPHSVLSGSREEDGKGSTLLAG